MARFIITIGEKIQAGVFKGSIKKKTLAPLAFWRKKKAHSPQLTGYVAIVHEAIGKHEYMMARNVSGGWVLPTEEPRLSEKINGAWRPIGDNDITLAIKKAIGDYENKQ